VCNERSECGTQVNNGFDEEGDHPCKIGSQNDDALGTHQIYANPSKLAFGPLQGADEHLKTH